MLSVRHCGRCFILQIEKHGGIIMVSKDYSDSAIVYVLPAQLYGQANEMLTAARESGRRLETACDLLDRKSVV